LKKIREGPVLLPWAVYGKIEYCPFVAADACGLPAPALSNVSEAATTRLKTSSALIDDSNRDFKTLPHLESASSGQSSGWAAPRGCRPSIYCFVLLLVKDYYATV
jgi:hypothetical protein